MTVRAFVHGYDRVGWSIDADAEYTRRLLKEAGIELTRNPLAADVIHFVWWNQAMRFRHLRAFSRAKWLAVVTNTIRDDNEAFSKLRSFIDCWVGANRAQCEWLRGEGVVHGYQPFYVDESVFYPRGRTRQDLCAELGLDYERLAGRFLIGSFQRDSLGEDLSQYKWQKGPDRLVEVLAAMSVSPNLWCVILAGPRRHWIIEKLRAAGIPYAFVGEEPRAREDDAARNTRSRESMALLYDLVDAYVVSSRQEGGPKAIVEASLCRTPVISTRAGFAPDMLGSAALYDEVDEGAGMLARLMSDSAYRESVTDANYETVSAINNRSAAVDRWRTIYRSLVGRL